MITIFHIVGYIGYHRPQQGDGGRIAGALEDAQHIDQCHIADTGQVEQGGEQGGQRQARHKGGLLAETGRQTAGEEQYAQQLHHRIEGVEERETRGVGIALGGMEAQVAQQGSQRMGVGIALEIVVHAGTEDRQRDK